MRLPSLQPIQRLASLHWPMLFRHLLTIHRP
jgi:hypothetical protein